MWRCPRRVSTVVCVHEPHCQPPDCSGHGTCVDGRCECTSRFWRGAACNELDCGPSNCSQHGLCTESEWGAHKEGGALVEPQFSHARPASGLHGLLQLAATVMPDGRDRTAVRVSAPVAFKSSWRGWPCDTELLQCLPF